MIKRKYALVLLLVAVVSACKKGDEHSERFNNMLGHWRFTEMGRDTNRNNILDADERYPAPTNPISESEYFENGEGKGYFMVSNVIDTTDFKWHLLNNETVLRTTVNEGKANESTTDVELIEVTKQTLMYRTYRPDSTYGIYTKL